MNTHTIVVDIYQNLKIRGDADNQNRGVSGTRTFCITEQALTAAQIKNRSDLSTTRRSRVLYSHLALSENLHLPRRGPTSVVAS